MILIATFRLRFRLFHASCVIVIVKHALKLPKIALLAYHHYIITKISVIQIIVLQAITLNKIYASRVVLFVKSVPQPQLIVQAAMEFNFYIIKVV